MKNIYRLFFLAFLSLFILSSNSLPIKATCTGAKNCRACKNCKYCKHCSKNGGTCGVCK